MLTDAIFYKRTLGTMDELIVDLIREFQMRHARLSADQVGVPMVDAAPVPLIDDRHRIVDRSSSLPHPLLPSPPTHPSK